MKHVLLAILCSALFITEAKEFNSWVGIDQQNNPYIKQFYNGELKKIYDEVKKLAEENDPVAQYTLAHMYDFAAKHLDCGGYRNCHINFYTPKDGFELSNSQALKWYREAINNGHPYATYMLYWHKRLDGEPPSEKRENLVIKSLLPLVESGDGVATFMYYRTLNKTFSVTPQTNNFSHKKTVEDLHTIIKALKPEAEEGRILSMHYLGRAYFALWDYPKAFAWFTVANKLGHAPSEVYQKSVFQFIEKEGLSEQAIIELDKVLSTFQQL